MRRAKHIRAQVRFHDPAFVLEDRLRAPQGFQPNVGVVMQLRARTVRVGLPFHPMTVGQLQGEFSHRFHQDRSGGYQAPSGYLLWLRIS